MNKKLVDGLVLSSSALLLAVITSFSIKNTNFTFFSGLVGGIGSTIALQHQAKQRTSINQLQQQLNQLQIQQHLTSDRIFEPASKDIFLAEKHDDFIYE